MLCNNMFFFSFLPDPLHLNRRLNIVILKHFVYYKIFGEIFFFSSQICLQVILFENLNDACTLTEMKHNLLD